MKIILTILGYLRWHYGKAVLSLSRIWGNFLFFISEFFSIKLLFRNYFDSWKRMAEPYPKTFELKKYFYTFVANTIVRTVGIIMRTLLIIVSLSCYLLLVLLYPIALITWMFLPFIVFFLIIQGGILIIK